MVSEGIRNRAKKHIWNRLGARDDPRLRQLRCRLARSTLTSHSAGPDTSHHVLITGSSYWAVVLLQRDLLRMGWLLVYSCGPMVWGIVWQRHFILDCRHLQSGLSRCCNLSLKLRHPIHRFDVCGCLYRWIIRLCTIFQPIGPSIHLFQSLNFVPFSNWGVFHLVKRDEIWQGLRHWF